MTSTTTAEYLGAEELAPNAWLHKNKAQLLAATPDRQKAELEAGFDRLSASSAELEARNDRLSADSIGTRVAKVASFAIACGAFNPRLVTGQSATAVGLKIAVLFGVSVLTTDQPRMVRFFDGAVQAGTKLVEAAKACFKKS